jgi:hypothetical protein
VVYFPLEENGGWLLGGLGERGIFKDPYSTDFLQLEMTNLQISFTYKIYSKIKYLKPSSKDKSGHMHESFT